MNEGSPFAPQPARPRFQFSLAAAFHLVTGTAVALSLITWEPALGSLAAVVAVGSWWATLARRAGRRSLAYYLAAFTLGEIGGVVFLAPLVLFTGGLGSGAFDRDTVGPMAVFCLIMATATVLSTRVLRRMIRWGKGANLPGTGITAVYVTAMFFVVVLCVGYVVGAVLAAVVRWDAREWLPLSEIAYLPAIGMAGVAASLVVATIWLPLMAPTAMLFCWVLQRIDPDPIVPQPLVQVELSDAAEIPPSEGPFPEIGSK